MFAVDQDVHQAGGVDPIQDGVVPGVRVDELPTLDVDRAANKKVIAAHMVVVQVSVHHEIDAREVEIHLLVQRLDVGVHVCGIRVQLCQSGVNQHTTLRMVDHVDVDGQSFVAGLEVSDTHSVDRSRGVMGTQLGEQLKAARTSGLLLDSASPLVDGIGKALSSVPSIRNQNSDAHPSSAPVTDADAWLVVHLVVAFILHVVERSEQMP